MDMHGFSSISRIKIDMSQFLIQLAFIIIT
jgi:hypothetical protein